MILLLEVDRWLLGGTREIQLLGRNAALALIIEGLLKFVQLLRDLVDGSTDLEELSLGLNYVNRAILTFIILHLSDLLTNFVKDPAAIVSVVMDKSQERCETFLLHPIINDIEGGPFLANQQYFFSRGHRISEKVANQL